jgi:N-terminal conserved domain of Nudc./CS domain
MSLPIPSTLSLLDTSNNELMDGPLIELANRSGGDLRKLLFAFFSFLHRRTDFYCIPHEDDAGKDHRLGFMNGDAEKLLLAAFRQFPLRKLPKQKARDPPGLRNHKDVIPTVENNQLEHEEPSELDTLTQSADSMKIGMAEDVSPDFSQINSGVKSNTTSNSLKVQESHDPMASIRFTDEGKQYPVGNGGSTSKFQWTQTLEEVTVIIGLPLGIKAKDLQVEFKSTSLLIRRKTQNDAARVSSTLDESDPSLILKGSWSNRIQPGESTWSMEGSVMLLTLHKARKNWWNCVLVGDPTIDTSLIDSRRRLHEYDEATQAALRRIIHQQSQQGSKSSWGTTTFPGKLPDGVEYIDSNLLDRNLRSREGSD